MSRRPLVAPQRPAPSRPSSEPTVLVIGADETFLPALRLALARHQVYVETSLVASAVETVVVTAPDLVLLVGEAAKDSGSTVLKQLLASPVSSVVPVALLGDETALDVRLRAFRHGAAAVIPRSASVDAIAAQVAELAREIPERGGAALGVIGEATLSEFVNTLHKELRSGILSVQQRDGDAPVRLVLGGGRPLADFIDDFVRRVRRHVVHAEPLEYEFDDRAGGTVQLLANESRGSEPPPGSIEGVRIVLADDNPARVDVVAQELRARGATVVVSDFSPDPGQFARTRQIDPEVLMIGESELEGAGYPLLKRMKSDTRLRWASLLVVRWSEIWQDSLAVPSVDRIGGALAALAEPDRGLLDRSELGDAFDARLELTGPARCLRALSACKRPLRLSVHNARVSLEIDLSDGLVVGATARGKNGELWEGPPALAAFLVLSTGRVHVEPVQQPATTNVMATVDMALNLAESERAPITASIPAPVESQLREPPAPPHGALASVPAPPTPAPVTSTPAFESSIAAPKSRAPWWSRLRRPGISRPVAIGLLGLAVMQGILVAAALGVLVRGCRSPALPTEPSARVLLDAAVAKPSAEAPVAPAAPRSEPPADPPLAASSAPAPRAIEESGARAPTCDELLAGTSVGNASYPGAAYEQLKLARRALVKGESDQAQRAYCTAVRWDAGNPSHYFELAQLLLLRRDGAAAAEWAERGVRLEPNSTRGNSLLGDGLARQGDSEGAKRAWFAAANVHDPSPNDVHDLVKRSLQEAEQALGRRDAARAERFFRRAAILDPGNVAARVGLSTALLRQGETAPALRWAEQASALAPRDPAALLALGDAALAASDQARARQQFQAAADLGHPEAKRRLRRLP